MKIRELKGYLYCIPFVGDRWVLTPQNYGKPPEKDSREFWMRFLDRVKKEHDIDSLFDGLEGKLIRVTVEVLEHDTMKQQEGGERGEARD